MSRNRAATSMRACCRAAVGFAFTLLAVAPALTLLAGSPAAAAAGGRPVTAWWSSTDVGHGLPAVPQPGVGARQLFVEGSNAAPPVSLLSSAPGSAQAVTALRWTLPAHTRPGSLRLRLSGRVPPVSSVTACRITAAFRPAADGAWSDVPAHDCTKPVDGSLAGSTLTFSGLAALQAGRTLSILLVPGPLDRMVIAPPTATSLRLVSVRSSTPPPVPAGSPAPGVTTGHGGRAGHTASSASTPGGTVPGLRPPVAGSTGVASGTALAPQVAGGSTGARPPAVARQALGAQLIPAAGWRRWTAFAVVAAEAVGFVVLQRRRPAADPATRGVGRFARAREGRPVPL